MERPKFQLSRLFSGGLLLSCLFQPSLNALQEDASVYFAKSPRRSVSANIQVLDAVGLEVVLRLGYSNEDNPQIAWRTPGLAGVKEVRRFWKDSAGGLQTVEIAIAAYPGGGYQVILHGLQKSPGGDSPNPDLFAVQATLTTILSELSSSESGDLRHLKQVTYPLSYIQADRALAILKVLGYTSVEFSQTPGETLFDKIYQPVQNGTGSLPIIVKMIDSLKTSLQAPPPSDPSSFGAVQPLPAGGGYGTVAAVPEIGGTYLAEMTAGEPQQRLMILYDEDDPESLMSLMRLLREKIDVAARLIVIEALVIEINSDRLRDIGVSFSSSQARTDFSFGTEDAEGNIAPFIFSFDSEKFPFSNFQIQLQALLQTGDAQLLSKPSVLVLDGRQARIQIGQQVPVVKSASTQAGIISSVDYFPVGIVLNLRPRINENGEEISMQVETIVSAVNSLASSEAGGAAQVFLAPIVDNRQVQTIVRVANDAPFIIAGLIQTLERESVEGIPWLSEIPGLGVLFRRRTVSKERAEVIVVVIPHVVPNSEPDFSPLIPKDSGVFESFDYELFRNAYRIKDEDVFDLKFVQESQVLQDLRADLTDENKYNPELMQSEAAQTIASGGIPGEEILVRRMLWEIINKTDFSDDIDDSRIILFEDRPDAPDGSGFQLAFLNRMLPAAKSGESLGIVYEASPKTTTDHPFAQPKAQFKRGNVTADNYLARLMELNPKNPDGSPRDWGILLSEAYPPSLRVPPLRLLKETIILKKVIDLNSALPLTIQSFHVGRQIVFPAKDDLQRRFHFIDRETAQLFYEVITYYPSFEKEFNRHARDLMAKLPPHN